MNKNILSHLHILKNLLYCQKCRKNTGVIEKHKFLCNSCYNKHRDNKNNNKNKEYENIELIMELDKEISEKIRKMKCNKIKLESNNTIENNEIETNDNYDKNTLEVITKHPIDNDTISNTEDIDKDLDLKESKHNIYIENNYKRLKKEENTKADSLDKKEYNISERAEDEQHFEKEMLNILDNTNTKDFKTNDITILKDNIEDITSNCENKENNNIEEMNKILSTPKSVTDNSDYNEDNKIFNEETNKYNDDNKIIDEENNSCNEENKIFNEENNSYNNNKLSIPDNDTSITTNEIYITDDNKYYEDNKVSIPDNKTSIPDNKIFKEYNLSDITKNKIFINIKVNRKDSIIFFENINILYTCTGLSTAEEYNILSHTNKYKNIKRKTEDDNKRKNNTLEILITKKDKNNRCRRTYKYLEALVKGYMVLDIKFIYHFTSVYGRKKEKEKYDKNISNYIPYDIFKYIIPGDKVLKNSNGVINRILDKDRIFENINFIVENIRDHIYKLIIDGGGSVIYKNIIKNTDGIEVDNKLEGQCIEDSICNEGNDKRNKKINIKIENDVEILDIISEGYNLKKLYKEVYLI
ncbi:hypothetical protein SLOPH_913 [Spraguea lophii 42_110]|uniref:BRCT domain-containing protein n=1 Tax=Spraguea lophii (strain 42_110) TaxID=1358809 RepID=S7WE45_SPRLO|nr:hypothetical protein SLOPH_913 [Spraguea lophii 42_110]